MTSLRLQIRLFSAVLVAALSLQVTNGAERESVSTLVGKLKKEPLEVWVLSALEDQPADPRIVPALEGAFERYQSKREKQHIAVTLLHLGDKTEAYFNLLAGYAKEAIDDRTPFFSMYDANGRAVRGQWNPEFEQWCRRNGKDMKEVGALQAQTYVEDMQFFASAQDSRATDLLKRGLLSQNPWVVYYSAEGLALLRDVSSISLIVKACERLPAEGAEFVAGGLAGYMTPEADQAMERFVKNPRLLDRNKRRAIQKRIDEANRALRRQAETDRK